MLSNESFNVSISYESIWSNITNWIKRNWSKLSNKIKTAWERYEIARGKRKDFEDFYKKEVDKKTTNKDKAKRLKDILDKKKYTEQQYKKDLEKLLDSAKQYDNYNNRHAGKVKNFGIPFTSKVDDIKRYEKLLNNAIRDKDKELIKDMLKSPSFKELTPLVKKARRELEKM